MTFHVALNRLWHATTVLIHQKPNPGNPGNPGNPARICKIFTIIEGGCTTVPGSRTRPRSVGRERQLSPGRDQAIPNYRWGKRTRGTGPRATVSLGSRGTGPRATFISPSSPHRTSSMHDSQETQAPPTDASPTSHAYHQMKPPQFDSSIQLPASPRYR